MLNIKEEIQVLLLRKGLSMSKMTRNMKKEGLSNINVASLSRMLSTKTVKFETIQLILDYLGYELNIAHKKNDFIHLPILLIFCIFSYIYQKCRLCKFFHQMRFLLSYLNLFCKYLFFSIYQEFLCLDARMRLDLLIL